MNRLRIFIACAAMLFAVGCNDDDTFEVSSQTLAQTVWDAEIAYYGEDDSITGTNRFVFEFLSETEGKYNEPILQIVHQFTYKVDRSIIVIDSGNTTTMNGSWYVVEKSKKQLVLQRYSPQKTIVTLNRIL